MLDSKAVLASCCARRCRRRACRGLPSEITQSGVGGRTPKVTCDSFMKGAPPLGALRPTRGNVMAKNKDFKRLVRARMVEHDERYTAAHAALTARVGLKITEAPGDREAEARRLLVEFEDARAADPKADAADLLDRALAVLGPVMSAEAVTAETVRLARLILQARWDQEAMIRLLAHYLTMSLPAEEEFWARWHYGDTLAMLARDSEAVEVQLDLLHWTREHLPNSFLPEVWHDSTMYGPWSRTERTEEWLGHYRTIAATSEATAGNRPFRFEMHFTAANAFRALERDHEREVALALLRDILAEDPNWDERPWAEHRLELGGLFDAQRAGDVPRLRELAERHVGWSRDAGWLASEGGSEPITYSNLGFLFLGVGSDEALLAAAEYFERGIAAGDLGGYGYLWYASAVWAMGHDRPRVIELLREARQRLSAAETMQVFRGCRQFADVYDDAEFVAVISSP